MDSYAAAVLLFIATGFGSFAHATSSAGDEVTIEGKVIIEAGKRAILSSQGKRIPLTSDDSNTAATFSDSRLSGREMRLHGEFRKDGSFGIHKFFAVRSGTLYRLIYFCET